MNEASSSRRESVVLDVGRRRSSCGYCKSGRRSSVSHGMWAYSLTVQDYQDLLDQGWRRSGCFLYKPEMETTCCPPYTIRLRADDFIPSKEQVRVLKRMNRYLDGELDVRKLDKCEDSGALLEHNNGRLSRLSEMESSGNSNEGKSQEEQLMSLLSGKIDIAVQICIKDGHLPSDVQYPRGSVKKVAGSKKRQFVEGLEELLYTSNISFPIAAAIRRANSGMKGVLQPESPKLEMNETKSSFELSPKHIAEKVANSLQHLCEYPDIRIRACNGYINFCSAADYDTSGKQDHHPIVSRESGDRCERNEKNKRLKQPQIKKRRFEIRLQRSTFDPEEYMLYRKYQIEVHNDSPDRVTESSYRGFLIDTPLIYVPPTADNNVPPCGFGSFHQQYIVDGKLVAVGVVDILPKCLSSKYLFWDPDYAILSLGKFSALKEIECIKQNEGSCPSLQYYYLGYYIHTCNKMRYKASYRPSELLCPLRYQWIPFSIAKPLLDRSKYAVLSNFTSAANGDSSAILEEPENSTGGQHDDMNPGDSNEIHVDGDVEMSRSDSESSDDELFPETSHSASADGEDGNVGNIVIDMNGYRLRYKDLRRALGPNEQNHFEDQLRGYMKVVGPQLAERMVYTLNDLR